MNAVTSLLTLQVVISTASLLHVVTGRGTLTLEGRQRGTDGYIQGFFKSDGEDEGIRFKTASDSLIITTMDHETLLKINKIPVAMQAYGEKNHAVIFQILDTAFAESNDLTYHVFRANTPIVQGGGRFLSHANFLASVQAVELYDPQHAIRSSVMKLLAHPAARHLEPAARALGEDVGIIGRDEPAALRFYTTVMKISEAFDDIRRLRASRSSQRFSTFHQPYPFCDMTTCPPCRSDQCVGMCGRKCSCWKFVCGDCCVHRGCEMHDVCCREHGVWSIKCLSGFRLVIGKNSCDSPYDC